MTPRELREKVVDALCYARGGFSDAEGCDEQMADAAIAVVLAECVEVCESRAHFYYAPRIGTEDPLARLDALHTAYGCDSCASAISALKLPPATDGTGEKTL